MLLESPIPSSPGKKSCTYDVLSLTGILLIRLRSSNVLFGSPVLPFFLLQTRLIKALRIFFSFAWEVIRWAVLKIRKCKWGFFVNSKNWNE